MQITNDHISKRFAWKERNDVVKYGTLKDITGTFGDMAIEGSSRAHYYVPLDTMWLVDEDGAPITP